MIHALVVVGKNIKNVVDKRFCVQFRSFFLQNQPGGANGRKTAVFRKKSV